MKNNVIVTLLFCFHSFVNAQDVSNSKDHELLTRYPGTEIKKLLRTSILWNTVCYLSRELWKRSWKMVRGFRKTNFFSIWSSQRQKYIRNHEKLWRNIQTSKCGNPFSCKGGECDGTTSWYAAKFFNTIYSENNRQSNGENDHYFDFGAYHVSQQDI